MLKSEGSYLGFDFGMKRIGVAVGQTISKTAMPLTTLAAKEGEPNWQDIHLLVREWHPKAFIVGLPVKMDDTEQFTTQAARNFADSLSRSFSLPVHLIDERLTSKEARQRLFERGGAKALQSGKVDQIAAVLILEQWLVDFVS